MSAPQVHDLLRIRSDAARFAIQPDDWVLRSLEATPWVVTRRAAPIAGWIPIGVRGETRDRRQAALVAADAVLDVLRPEDLASRRPPRRHAVFDALAALAPDLDGTGCRWGPIGAAGFELASSYPALRADSDLDIALRIDRSIALDDLDSLLRGMRKVDIRVDILVETPRGGLAISEALGDSAQVLLRSASGPRLMPRRELNSALLSKSLR